MGSSYCWPLTPSWLNPVCLQHLQFTRNAFGLSFLLLLLVSLAMTAFGFFVAAFLHKVGNRPATQAVEHMPATIACLCAAEPVRALQHPHLRTVQLSSGFSRAWQARLCSPPWCLQMRVCPCPASSQASAAVPAGFMLFVLAWVILIVVAFGFPFK